MEAAMDQVKEAGEVLKIPGKLPTALALAKQAIAALEPLEAAVPPAEGQEAAEEAKALASALTMAGELYLALALPTDAVAALKRAMSLHPGQVRCTASYAAALGSGGQLEEGKKLLEAYENPAKMEIPELLALGKALMILGEDAKGEQLLKSAWARGGDPYELANAQIGKYLKGRSDEKCGDAVDGYKTAQESLKNAARVNCKDPRPRYKLGLLMEEAYHHALVYGGGKKAATEGDPTNIGEEVQQSQFKTWSASAMEDEILAIGQIHGYVFEPTIEELLQALLTEHRANVDAGKIAEADTVMVLYNFKSRQLVAQGKKGGTHLKVDKNLQNAAKEYEECVRDNNVPEVLLHLARAQKLMGSSEKAAATAEKAAKLEKEHAASQLYAALLAQPLDLDGGKPCPDALFAVAPAVTACVDRAVEAGPAIRGMLLGEELCHGVNPDLSLAAVAVARGHNAAGQYTEAEALCKKLMGLLPPTMANIHWASVLQAELATLCGNAREELLKALQSRKAGEEGVPVYEELYALVSENPGRSLKAIDRLVQCCKIGCEFRPDSSEFKVRLADALWMRVDNDNDYLKKDNKDKKLAVLAEVEKLLRDSMALEGKPHFDATAAAAAATTTAPATPERKVESEPPKEAEPPEPAPVPAAAAPAAKPGAAATKTGATATKPGAATSKLAAAASKTAPAKPALGRAAPAAKAPAAKAPTTAKAPAAAAKPAVGRAATTAKAPVKPAVGAKAAPAAKAPAGKAAAAPAAKPAAAPAAKASEPPKAAEPPKPPPIPVNARSFKARIDLARVLRELGTMSSLTDEVREECIKMYQEARVEQPRNVDACVGIGQLLVEKDPLKAIEEMSKFPDPEGFERGGKHGKPNFDDSFVHVEIARTIIKHATDTKDREMLECEQVEKSLSIAGKVMGWDGIDKWVDQLDNRGKWDMLKRIYMAIQEDNPEVDEDMVKGYFTVKGWDPVIVPRRYDVPTQ